MTKIAFFMSVLALQGCSLPYNSPARFMGRLDPETLATIEPPLHDDHPDWPTLKGPDYSHSYQKPAYGPAYGSWGVK